MKFLGEIAALATAFFFALTALIFTSTGRSVGSQVTNRMRLLFALIYLIVLKFDCFSRTVTFFRRLFTLACGSVFRGSLVFRSAMRFCFSLEWEDRNKNGNIH